MKISWVEQANKESEPKTSDFNKEVETSEKNKRKVFNNMVEFAMDTATNIDPRYKPEINNINPERNPIFDAIKLIGLRTQTKYITNLLYKVEEDERLPDISPSYFLFDDNMIVDEGRNMYDLFDERQKEGYEAFFNIDLIYPWAWNTSRYLNSISNIGKGRAYGEWRQDDNHYIEMWLPMRTCFVYSGNHSITAGIIQNSRTVKPEKVYDISPIYDYLYTDGINYYRKNDDSIIAKVNDLEFAAIFEIGRFMKDEGIE